MKVAGEAFAGEVGAPPAQVRISGFGILEGTNRISNLAVPTRSCDRAITIGTRGPLTLSMGPSKPK